MSPASNVSASAGVSPNLAHAFGGIWRLTYRRFLTPAHLLGLAGLVVLCTVPLNLIMQGSRDNFFFQWTSGFYLTFLIPILSFLTGASAVREDMKPESVDYVLIRPVRRPVFFTFKFICHLACVQATYLVAFGATVALACYRHVPLVLPAVPWLLAGQVITVTVFGALGVLCGVLTARYLLIGLFYVGIVELAIGNIPTQLNRLSLTHQVKMLLQPMLVWTQPELKPEQSVLTSVTVLFVFSLVMLVVAGVVFTYREFAGARTGEI